MANSSQDIDDFEKKVLKFTAGNSEWIEDEEEYEEGLDEVDGGKVDPEYAEQRIDSGWYGDQHPQRQRISMDRELTTATLCEKAGCTEEDINSHGLYRFTHAETGEDYVGKAEKQSLNKRLMQHINKAISERELTGKFDPFLRDHPEMDDWDLKIWPMEQREVARAEKHVIQKLVPSLNVQMYSGQ